MNEIIFQILQDEIDGVFSASALGFAIHTEAETLDELRVNISEAVACHFDNSHETPKLVRLYFVHSDHDATKRGKPCNDTRSSSAKSQHIGVDFEKHLHSS